MIRCDYTFTYPDFVAAVVANRRVHKNAGRGYAIYVWIVPIVCAGIAAKLCYELVKIDTTLDFWKIFFAVLAAALAIGMPVRYQEQVRQAFESRALFSKDKVMHCEFDDSNVHFSVPDGPQVTYPWSAFSNYVDNEKVFVVFVKEATFHTIPKRAMQEPLWDKFRAYAKNAGVIAC